MSQKCYETTALLENLGLDFHPEKASFIPSQVFIIMGFVMIKCQHYWLNSLDKKSNCVRVFLFDLSKAFDTVSHRIVFNKVKDLEINPYVVNWSIDFQRNGKQRVAVDGNISEFVDINREVPQGTVLRPVLFSRGERYIPC